MFVACFSVAEVSLVSMVAVQGCAVVMAVSCWPASAVAEVPPVSTPPRGCVLRANLFALRGPMVCVSAKKLVSALKMAENRRFCACWASFFADKPTEPPRWASFVAGEPERPVVG